MDKSNGTYMLAGAVIVAGLLIGLGVYLGGGSDNTQVNSGDNRPSNEVSIRPVSEDDHILGNPNADVVVIEYSDTECPFCKDFHDVMNSIMESEKYGKSGSVAWVYRHFPLDSIHSKARTEAYATECANELGGSNGFWNYINRLYEITPSNNRLDLDKLPEIAEEVGLDRMAFETCLESNKYREKVQAHFEEATKAGGRGTPHNILVTKNGNSYVLPGFLPEIGMTQVLDIVIDSVKTNKTQEETSLQIQRLLGR